MNAVASDSRLIGVLFDGLSVSNLSGQHVLFGHLRQLVATRGDRWRIGLLLNQDNAALRDAAPEGVEVHIAPVGSRWWQRGLWVKTRSTAWCRERKFDITFSPAGMLGAGGDTQVVLAQNPWPLMPVALIGRGRFRAWVQRRQFARAHARATYMAFNSCFMRDLYRRRFGKRVGRDMLLYQGISAELLDRGRSIGAETGREPIIVSVSVMARHKAVEVLVAAFAQVAKIAAHARLEIVGPWPDSEYRCEIEALIRLHHLTESVRIHGFLEDSELERLLLRARVFALLSRCESFGIPAVEAQALGVPAVVAAGTAAPEIIGDGGTVVPTGDIDATAAALLELLSIGERWQAASRRASANAQRFHWQSCSAPLVAALDEIAAGLKTRARI